LRSYAASTKRDPSGLVFATTSGAAHGATNIRKRVLAPAIKTANELLSIDENGEPREHVEPIPTAITPHSLLRMFASILFAVGESPPYVMAQMGHTTAELTLAIYARQMDRRDGEPERLRALVEGRDTTEFRLSDGRAAAVKVRESAMASEAHH
jgi:integrase